MYSAQEESGSTPQAGTKIQRARSFHRPARAWLVSLMLFLAFELFVAFLVLAVMMLLRESRLLGYWSIGCLAGFIITRTLAFVWSRGLTCPLCHGTVLSDRRCRKHDDAPKLPLLSHKATAVLGILFTLGFRCMYCGTAYRLWKR